MDKKPLENVVTGVVEKGMLKISDKKWHRRREYMQIVTSPTKKMSKFLFSTCFWSA